MLINVDFIYPIGSIYITTNENFNPQKSFGGTWQRLEGDVYLKNVPSSSGQVIGAEGGTSEDHKIPIESMPSHTHSSKYHIAYDYGGAAWGSAIAQQSGYTISAGKNLKELAAETGGDQPYYPYYYGVICWERTA